MVLVDPTEQTEGLSHSSVLKQGAAFPGSSNSHPGLTAPAQTNLLDGLFPCPPAQESWES